MGSGRERGMSLVELLIAILILAFVALGIAGLFSHAQLTNASGYSYAVLASEARRALEGMNSLSFDDVLLADTAGTPRNWPQAGRGFIVRYLVQDYGLAGWHSVFDTATGALDPGSWPAPDAVNGARLKRITIRVSSTNRFLTGRREFVVSTFKIPDIAL